MMKILRNKTRRYIMKNPHIDALVFAIFGVTLMFVLQLTWGQFYPIEPTPPNVHVEYWFMPMSIWLLVFMIFAILYFLFTNGKDD